MCGIKPLVLYLAPGAKLVLLMDMLTKDEREQLGQVIDARLDVKLRAEREHTRKMVKEELAANNTVLGTIVRVEIAAAKEELVKKGEKIYQP